MRVYATYVKQTVTVLLAVSSVSLLFSGLAMAGGIVNGGQTLDPAMSMDSGTVSFTPPFNNAQFNNRVLVGTVHNDPIKTPSTADPVSTVSGNNYHDETDFQIRGRNGLNYVFTRTYNSAQSASGVDIGLGYGWVHSYGMKLVSNDFGVCPNCDSTKAVENGNNKTSSITYTDERGGQQNFLVDETSYAVTKPMGVFDTLALDTPVQGQHTLTFRNGAQYVFETLNGVIQTTPNVASRLKTIKNVWGDQLNLTYDTMGRLASIADNLGIAGRTGITFNYTGNDKHITSVSDWTGRSWSFSYPNNYLDSYTDPLNNVLQYGYTSQTFYNDTQNTTGNQLLYFALKPLTRNGLQVYTAFKYYQNGRTLEDFNGMRNTEIMDYDLYRMRTRVTDPRNNVREYDYDGNGFQIKMINADGGILYFGTQGDGLRYTKFDALGYATQYSYCKNLSLTACTTGATSMLSDTGGNVSLEQDALSNKITTTYGPYDQVASVKDKNGTTTTTSFYTTTGTLATGCDLTGKPQAITLSMLNATANVKLKDFCWNSNGTLKSMTEYLDPAGAHKRTTTLIYDPASNGLNLTDILVTATNTPVSIHSQYTSDALGRTTSTTVFRTTSMTNSALVALTTTYSYDALDRAIQVKNPEGRIQEKIYDANGKVYQEKSWYPSAVARTGCEAPTIVNSVSYVVCTEASHQYDAADRRISTTDINGNTTKFVYDPSDNLIKQTDANGHSTRYEYDAMNRRTAVIDANGRRMETVYNQRGDVLSITNANGETITNAYDAIGRLIQVTDNLGYITKYQYDANGNKTCMIDANATSATSVAGHQPVNSKGCTVSYTYDQLNRLLTSVDAQNAATSYGYDLLGNRLTVTDAATHVTKSVYDDLGRLTATIDPLLAATNYITDEAGNIIQITDRKGQISQHDYDLLNRKVQSKYLTDNTTDTYIYDNYDDLVHVQNDAVTYDYGYDNKHRMLSKTDTRPDSTLINSLNWTFDNAGNILTKSDYQGSVTTYQYDNSNRLVAESNPSYLEVSYHYDPAGRLLDRILSNGASTHYDWDAGGRLTQLSNITLTGQIINNTSYTRDNIGNILTQSEANVAGGGTNKITFKYDPEYRLLSSVHTGVGTAVNATYTFDKVGNRIVTKLNYVPVLSLFHNYDAANRMVDTRTVSATGPVYESYGVDKNGSITQIKGPLRNLTITWDAKNRVSSIKKPPTVPVVLPDTFKYDPSGYRIYKNDTAGSNRYYLQSEHLEAVYDDAGNLKAKYMRGSVIDEVVNGYQADSTGKLINYTFHHDNLQSVLGQSGHDGSILSTQSYSEFGNVVNPTGSSNNMLKYTGRELDNDTGLYYYRARYYDWLIGRFISEDPKGFEAGINFYAYCANNPINCNDPTGNSAAIRAGLGCVAAFASGLGYTLATLSDDESNFSWTNLTIASGTGFVVGFAAPATFGKAMLLGSSANVFQYGLTQAVNDEESTPVGYATNALTGLVGGAIGGPISTVSLRYADNLLYSGFNNFWDSMGVNTANAAFARNLGGGVVSNYNVSSLFESYPSLDENILSSYEEDMSNFTNDAVAYGGFVLYTSKSNTSMVRRVYSK
jgi:RHS repeat-associated protein